MKQSPEAKFSAALSAAILECFGKDYAFAQALGVSAGRISQIRSNPRSLRIDGLEALLRAIPSPVHRDQVLRAWQALPQPQEIERSGDPPEAVIRRVEGLVAAGLVESAIRLLGAEMEGEKEHERWIPLAERLHPLQLQLARHGDAARLRAEMERRSKEAGDMRSVVASLAMAETMLSSMDATRVSWLSSAQETTLAAMERWSPKGSEGQDQKRWRDLNIRRSHGLAILGMVGRGRVRKEELEHALKLCESSISDDSPDYIQACGMEVRSRILAAKGDAFLAEEAVDELEEFGLDKSWGAWEKTRFALAKAAESRGETDAALQILEEVRAHCREISSLHYARKAEQEIARILLGFEG